MSRVKCQMSHVACDLSQLSPLTLVKVGLSIICAAMFKLGPTFHRNYFHEVPTANYTKKIQKNPKVITILQKKRGGARRCDHIYRFNGYFFEIFP